jgi:hypothetical protein
MVATTQVRFLVGANYGVEFKKNPLAGETGVRGFSGPGEGFFFLMKTVGRSYPHRPSFFLTHSNEKRAPKTPASFSAFGLLRVSLFSFLVSCW